MDHAYDFSQKIHKRFFPLVRGYVGRIDDTHDLFTRPRFLKAKVVVVIRPADERHTALDDKQRRNSNDLISQAGENLLVRANAMVQISLGNQGQILDERFRVERKVFGRGRPRRRNASIEKRGDVRVTSTEPAPANLFNKPV